jgi:hypothetical protein
MNPPESHFLQMKFAGWQIGSPQILLQNIHVRLERWTVKHKAYYHGARVFCWGFNSPDTFSDDAPDASPLYVEEIC